MTISIQQKRIIIAKTNQIGDVVFALPLASALKQADPSCHIIFLSRAYTQSLIEQYRDVDEFADVEAIQAEDEQTQITALKALRADIIIHVNPRRDLARLAYQAGIRYRVGTSHRWYHWLWCNRRVNIPRKHSALHETQLDMQLLKPLLNNSCQYSLTEITQLRHFHPFSAQQKATIQHYLKSDKFNLILHPKTRGEHIEWSPQHFATLINALATDRFHIIVTGSAAEGEKIRDTMLSPFTHVTDLTGKISLTELMTLIAFADGLICASTGPVHLAAAFGIPTLGLYAPIKPFDAGRWGPVGSQAEMLCVNKSCEACRYTPRCHCIDEIAVEDVLAVVERFAAAKAEKSQSSKKHVKMAFPSV